MHPRTSILFALIALGAGTGTAAAHVSVGSGPAIANKSQKITFAIGHGCEGLDTYRIQLEIPAGLTSVRALRSDFGTPAVARDVDGDVTSVTWQKPLAELLAGDDAYYEVTIRARLADVPFTRIPFVVHQTCRDADGNETTVSWDGITNEAPELVVVPARQSGWNRYALATAIAEADVPTFLGDALIVWRGAAAYSSNASTAALIASTPGVTVLTGDLAIGDELWVRY